MSDIRLNQKTIVVDYSATRLTVAIQQTFTFYNYIYVNMSTQQPMLAKVFQLTTVRTMQGGVTVNQTHSSWLADDL